MDVFYRHENIDYLKKWVYYQIKDDQRFKVEQTDDKTLLIYYENRVATYCVWPMGIIEESVVEDGNILFYLHFQFRNFHFCTDMFQRMLKTLVEEKKIIKVLLCCTGGMTTGFFAEKLSRYCELNNLPYKIDAYPSYHLDNVYMNYDYMFLAPQLKHKLLEFKQKYNTLEVRCIDPTTFATYNCLELLKELK